MPVLKSIATLAHETVTTAAKVESGLRRGKMPSAAVLVVRYSGQLEYYADVVREMLSGRLDDATATYRHPELSRIVFDALDRRIPG